MKIDFEQMRRDSEAKLGIVHKDGTAWHQATKPRWLHRCQVQTTGWSGLRLIERCACGAIRMDGRRWLERNSR